MDEGRKAQVVCVDNKNMHGVRDKPDLEFQMNGKRYLIDVSFVNERDSEKETDQNARFEGKILKYLNNPGIAGNREQIIPIIISYSGILFRKSALLLDNLIEEIKPPMLYKVIYREIAMAWKYVENLTQEKRMSYLEDGRHHMNGEIEDEAESMS